MSLTAVGSKQPALAQSLVQSLPQAFHVSTQVAKILLVCDWENIVISVLHWQSCNYTALWGDLLRSFYCSIGDDFLMMVVRMMQTWKLQFPNRK